MAPRGSHSPEKVLAVLVIARYGSAPGRENVIPRVFGRTVDGVPRVASIAHSMLALIVISVYAVAGGDPLITLFCWGGGPGGFGVLLLITVISVAVIAYFAHRLRDETLWRRAVAPLIATALLLVLAAATLDNLPIRYGVEGWIGPALFVPAAYLGAAVRRVLWALWLRANRRTVYDGIGLGTARIATSVTRAATRRRETTLKDPR